MVLPEKGLAVADSAFGFGPMGVLPDQPAKPEDKRRNIDALASQHQVPANVLMALDEAGITDTATAAQKIAADMKSGKTVDQIVGPDVMNRAYDIADQIYPRPAPAKPEPKATGGNLATDLAVEGVGGAAQGVILGARGAGELATAAANALLNGPVSAAVKGATGHGLSVNLQNPTTGVTDQASNWVNDKIDANLTPETKQAIADSQITGDPLHPSTIDFGKNPSLRGIAAQGANVVGNLLPSFIMATMTGGATLPNAAAGMAMAAGDQAQSSDQFIDQLAKEHLPDGRSRLEVESPVYRELIAKGMPAADALAATKSQAAQLAAVLSAPIGAIGGAIEGKLFNPAEKIIEGGNWATRTLGRGALGAITEGPQEAGEVVAGRVGSNIGAGTDQDLTQNTAADFILGALGGHVGGLGAGALSTRQQEEQPNTGGDGSAPGQDAAPGPTPPGAGPGVASAPFTPPSGPISAIAASAPDLTPQPEAPAPEPFFPDQKPGAAIKLTDEQDNTHDAVFLGEGPDGVSVRIDGEEVFLTPQEFDAARVKAAKAEEEAKKPATKAAKKPKAEPQQPDVPQFDDTEPSSPQEGPFDAAAQALKDQGYYDGPWNDAPPPPIPGGLAEQTQAVVKPPKAKPESSVALTPEQALAQAKRIEDTAKRGGWNKRLTKKHADLMAIANQGATDAASPVLDGSAAGDQPAPATGPADSRPIAGNQGVVEKPEPANPATGQPAVRGGQDGMADATATGKPDGSLTPKADSKSPRAPIAPMAKPDDRVQPDLLGGQPVTETEMAAKERRRREWGQFLPIAESTKSPWDGELEGRVVIVRPGKFTIRAGKEAGPLDITVDTHGNSRDAIAAHARGALNELDRLAPISAPVAPTKVEETKSLPKPASDSWWNTLGDAQAMAANVGFDRLSVGDDAWADLPKLKATVNERLKVMGHDDWLAPDQKPVKQIAPEKQQPAKEPAKSAPTDQEKPVATKVAPTIENIREKAAVLRGVPKDQPPAVDGISLKWDDKAGGFIFSRKHADKVAEAVGIRANTATPEAKPNDHRPQPLVIKELRSGKEKILYPKGSLENGYSATVSDTGTALTDAKGNQVMVSSRQYSQDELLSLSRGEKVREFTAPVPTATEVKAAAAEADKTPTQAQKEAGNYKMGHIAWNGLDLTIETPKGAKRSGTDSDGESWSVTMPAHYGYIKRTEGADGDHVDFYMGPNPESDKVYVIDQRNIAKRGLFDEHKVMLGFKDYASAEAAYFAGFSDGKGPQRKGHSLSLDVAEFKAVLKHGDWSYPMANLTRGKIDQWVKEDASGGLQIAQDRTEREGQTEAKPATYGASNTLVSTDRAAELRKRLQDKLRNQLNAGIDPEILAIGAELAVFHIEAGARRFMDLARAIASDLGTTPAKIRPYLRSWYNGARDMMEDAGLSIDGMDSAETVKTELTKLDAEASQETPKPAKVESQATKGTQDDHATDASVSGTSPGKSEGAERPRSESGRGSGEGRSGEDTGKSGTERTANERPQRRDDAEGANLLGRTGGTDGAVAPQNHVIEAGDLEVKAGEKTRAKNSVEAIRVLRKLEQEGRPATAEERQKLALYGGAGTLAAALPRSDGTIRFADLAADLDMLLDAEEKRTLARTSQYAFYTSETTLRSMWTLAQRLGFKGGRIYEPGMGVGGFAGTMPESLRGYGKYTGLELDHVTAKIAAALYPEHTIKQGDFIKEKLPNDYYDLVIGNPPFAGIKIQADPDYPQGFMLHDYFFAKSLDAVRPGGVLMFVTSAGTMNKMDSGARDYLADRADLLGAIRLPNTAFKENGTEVTTDIVVMRKRLPGEKEANPGWRNSDVIEVPDMDGGTGRAAVNRYFIEHPEMVLGEQGLFDTLAASDRIGVRPRPGSDFKADLAGAVLQFAPNALSEAAPSQILDVRDGAAPETKTGSYYLKDGELWQFDGRTGHKVTSRSKENSAGPSKSDYDLIRALVPLKLALRDVYHADVNGAKNADDLRSALNRAYDAFVEKRGPINLEVRSIRRPTVVEQEAARLEAYEEARTNGDDFDIGSFDPGPMLAAGAKMSEIARARTEARAQAGYTDGDFNVEAMPDKIVVKRPNIEPFEDDPESFRLRAIERYDSETDTAKKTRVFHESAVTLSTQPKISSPEDALLFLLADTGKVDLDRIADLAGSSPGVVRDDLGDKVFKDPATGTWETRSKYLSGNVRKKLRDAMQAAKSDSAYDINVQSLEQVQPDPVVASEIRVPIGAHWFPHSLYTDWAKSIGMRLVAKHQTSLGLWTVDGSNTDAKAQNEFGTADLPFADLMRRIMNNKSLKISRTVKDADGSTRTFVDDEATQAATDKAAELRDKFSEWFWSDDERSREMEGLYNEVFNAEVAPKYDGGYLTTPGIHSDWSWRPHQTAVVARILQSGSTYMAHTVGAGKTSAMIGAVMEARRLGIWKKPMVSVPNHMLVQFATEFYQQYPLANILVADEKRFHTSTRKQFIADVALGDWDAIIITHSAFGKIPASERAKQEAVKDMLSDIEAVLEDTGSKDRGDRSGDMATERSILGALQSIAATLGVKMDDKTEKGVSTRKKIERLLEAAEQRMSRQVSDVGKDQVFDFDELGVDALLLDEAHLFRKLSFATGLGNIKGVDPAGSMASMDLYVKTRALEKANPGRSLVLASGTPITNTMAEAYTISRYLQPQALADRGMSAFDAWAGTFGQVDSALEQTPDGGYKEVSRFAKFVNTPELSLMMRQVMDVVSGADLEKYVTRPKLKGGKRNLVVVEASSEVKSYQAELGQRMRMIENRKGPVQKGDDILLSVINDGRLSAIDMRLVDPFSSGNGSKLERMIANIFRVWKAGDNAPLHGVKKEGGYTIEPIMRGPTAQIVFSTLGINGSKRNEQFKVHRFIKSELIRMGVPATQIVLSEDMKTHAQKQNAFGDLNEGKKRVLIGSKSLFTGVNAQRRLAAIHNLDPLWFPADDEQRNGRGIRQGNMNPEIEIFDYSTKGTYDATMWQMMGRKAAFIEGFFRGDPGMREMEDLGEASVYEQAKAMSTADPRILELTDMKAERDKLQRRKGAIDTQRDRLGYEINRQDYWKADAQADIDLWEGILPTVRDLSGDQFQITLNGKTYAKRLDAGNALIEFAAESVAKADTAVHAKKVGEISGFPIFMSISLADQSASFSVDLAEGVAPDAGFSDDPVGMMRRLEGAVLSVHDRLSRAKTALQLAVRKQSDARQSLANVKDFSEGAKLRDLSDKIFDLESALKAENATPPKTKESRFDRQPVATLTGNELGPWEDIRQLGKKAEAWYRSNLVGKTVTNKDKGWVIGFNATGARKIGGRKGDELYRIVPAMAEILREGHVIESSPDSEGRRQITAVHKIAARVLLDGVPKDVIATIRETNEGAFHYDLSRDVNDEAKFLRFRATLTAEDGSQASALEGGPVELNLDFAAPEVNVASIPIDAMRTISAALAKETTASGLAGKVSPILVRNLLGKAGVPIQGRQFGARIEVSDLAADKIGVLRHEIVHALRDARLWDAPFGLFTGPEWRALAQAAGADESLMARVVKNYPELTDEQQVEEAVAEMYREWSAARDGAGLVLRAFNKVAAFFRAFASALRGEGFTDAAMIMDRIASGTVGGRGPDGPKGGGRDTAEMRPGLLKAQAKFKSMVGSRHWKNPGEFVSNIVTDMMAGKGDYSALALVPGRALFSELGKKFLSAKTYLRLKEEMDALRNDWHARADKVAQDWLKLRNKNPDANDAFMDLMHRSTLSGIDPSRPDTWQHAFGKAAENTISRYGDEAEPWAHDVMRQISEHEAAYAALRTPFEALPPEFQALYGKVRAQYDKLGDDFESAVLRNIANATKIGLKRAERAHRKEMERIKDEGLEGEEQDEAKAKADAALKAVKMRGGFSAKARIAALRKKFESNKLKGPYFPLARFGDYFVTVRNQDGKVVSFSRFEREAQQQAFIRELKEQGETKVEFGTMDSKKKLRAQIDPSFVADIENMLAESGANDEVMDAVWQRWLETLPDQSIRTAKIHRKGRKGYSNDAFRAFGSHMFHGAHQLARLEYGLPLEEALNEAEEEARVSDNPNRAGLLVAEMRKRHDFTMNPTGSSAVASMSGLAFVWYLGASPAAALANVSQTTVVGIPVMAARFRKAGVVGASRALGRAARDFMAGKGQAENAPNLTDGERAALIEAVRRGTIDKTQAHDLASVAETGIEYNANREKWMKRIGWFFHQAERFNREVTFLANYRLAKAEGQSHSDAIDTAADVTWKVHFDYQNTSRPRFMQNDIGRILTQFRQFSVNLIWRMFRDTHQMLHGASKEERREARVQLVGVTLSMMAHAGIRGTWGYGLLMMLLGMLTPGADDDDIKEWLQDALVMEGDTPGVAAWNYAMGAALNGVPGQVLGVDLSERIGMPNLWFREAPSDLEGADLYAHYVGEVLGPTYGIGQGFFRGAQLAADGEWWRGTEAAVPKVVRDAMKTARYVDEGVQTASGDTILESVNPYQALMQLGGFTPAKVAERYDINSRLKDQERQITGERSDIQRAAAAALLAGQTIPAGILTKIRDFNLRYPEYPITGDTIQQSARGKMRAQERSEFGITLNPKLNDRLRSERAPTIYN